VKGAASAPSTSSPAALRTLFLISPSLAK
jgi:hypothetical protein